MNEEQEKLVRAEQKEQQELADLFRVLTAHPAWSKYVDIVGKQILTRRNAVIYNSAIELEKGDSPTTVERLCGEIVGLELALKLPSTFIEAEEYQHANSSSDQSTDE